MREGIDDAERCRGMKEGSHYKEVRSGNPPNPRLAAATPVIHLPLCTRWKPELWLDWVSQPSNLLLPKISKGTPVDASEPVPGRILDRR
jgi:hypothetical protein